MKLAALLGDVVVEDGVYRLQAGPDGSFGGLDLPRDEDRSWQSPRERSFAKDRAPFQVAIGLPDQPLKMILQSETTLLWRATFGPLKDQIRSSYDWINFGAFDLNPRGKDIAKLLRDRDAAAGALSDESYFVRGRLLEHVANDTVVAAGMDAAVVVDRRHSKIMRCRVASGSARAVPSYEAAAVLEPDVHLLDWEDIDRLRRMRGWSELREVWTEVGELALGHAGSAAELETMVHQLYRDRLTEAALAAEGPRGIRRWAGPTSGMILGALPNLMTLSPPIAIGLGALASVAGELVGHSQRDQPERWVSASHALTTSIQRSLLRREIDRPDI
jgi:hypothetical protein